ncbi:DUF1978 domain-containing protein [Candidatus Chlamydia corallus]|uniref:DUF1978 domain-containing protein n=1 Tax=Candidatus Chlamydia corallus TaxID=2038470 RepID=UPI000C2FEBA0|nr:DUF1978 domain-containing protein [Candidatus Chlamydia corallus]
MVLGLDATRTLNFVPPHTLIQIPDSQFKARIFAKGLLVVGILILVCGIIFFSQAIPGCGLLVSLGLGLGTSVLGLLVFVLGGLLLFKLQEVIQEVPRAPHVIEIEDTSEPGRVKAKDSLTRLPKEICQLKNYIRSVEKGLNNIKNWSNEDERLIDKFKQKLKSLGSAHDYVISEFCEIRHILEEEEQNIALAEEYLAFVSRGIFNTAVDMESFLNLNHLSEIRPYLAVSNPKLLEITEKSQDVVNQFMNATVAFKKAQILFKNNKHAQIKKMLERSHALIEALIYKSLERSYNKAGLLCEKVRIIHDNPLFPWEQDQQKYTQAKKEFEERSRCLEEFEKTFFWLDDESTISYTDRWDFLNESIEHKMLRVDRDAISIRKIALKNRARNYAKALLEKERTKEHKRDLEQARRAFEYESKKFYRKEYAEAETRVKVLKTSFPNLEIATNIREVRSRSPEIPNHSEDVLEEIDKEHIEYENKQRLYWQKIGSEEEGVRKELEGESHSLNQSRRVYSAECYARRLKGLLLQWTKDIRTVEAHIEDAAIDFDQEISKIELRHAQARLELLEEEINDIFPKVADMEELISYEEHCIFSIRTNLEKAYIQYNKCSEMLLDAELFFAEDERFIHSDAMLRDMRYQLQQVSERYKEKKQEFTTLEDRVTGHKCLLKGEVQRFQLEGLDFLKDELLSTAYDLYKKAGAREHIPVGVPCMQLYYNYYEDKETIVRKRLFNMTERYQNFQRNLNCLKFDSEVLLKEELYKPEEHEKRQEERESKEAELLLKKLQVAEDHLSELESKQPQE